MTTKKPTVLTHPDSKVTVETHDPGTYLSQGWVAGDSAKSDK